MNSLKLASLYSYFMSSMYNVHSKNEKKMVEAWNPWCNRKFTRNLTLNSTMNKHRFWFRALSPLLRISIVLGSYVVVVLIRIDWFLQCFDPRICEHCKSRRTHNRLNAMTMTSHWVKGIVASYYLITLHIIIIIIHVHFYDFYMAQPQLANAHSLHQRYGYGRTGFIRSPNIIYADISDMVFYDMFNNNSQ